MNDDSSGNDGTGYGPHDDNSPTDAADSADLTRLILEGFEPIEPDKDVWRRIDNQLRKPEEKRQSSVRFGYLAAAAAVLLLVVGIAGAFTHIGSRRTSDAQPVTALQETVVRDLSDPITGEVELTIHTDGHGSSIAVSTGSLPVLDDSSTYQLWSVVGEEVVSVGVLGPSIDSAPLRLEGSPAVLALTVETAGGVAVSTADPVAVWATNS